MLVNSRCKYCKREYKANIQDGKTLECCSLLCRKNYFIACGCGFYSFNENKKVIENIYLPKKTMTTWEMIDDFKDKGLEIKN